MEKLSLDACLTFRFIQLWTLNAVRLTRRDLRTANWGLIVTRSLIACWVGALVGGVISLPLMAHSDETTACQPDGYFRLDFRTYSVWSPSAFFQITLGGGNLSFAQAKVIDIVWDVVVGRGGQALLAVVTWKTFAKYVTASMHIQPVTYRTYRNIFVCQGPSVPSLFHTIGDFTTRKGLTSKIAMVFILLEMLFIIAFPTLASAMTGYKSNVAAYIQDRSGNYLRFSQLSQLLYRIHDGDRIKKTKDYPIFSYKPDGGDPLITFTDRCDSGNEFDCNYQKQATEYLRRNYFFPRPDGESEWRAFSTSSYFMSQYLSAPRLNISAYFDDGRYQRCVEDIYSQLTCTNCPGSLWVYENETYNTDYITKQGTCQTMADYQWGFSFIQLYIMILYLLGWTIGMLLMWRHASLWLRKQANAVAGEYTSVLELATSLQQELSLQPLGPSPPTETEVRQLVKEKSGGSIAYSDRAIAEPPNILHQSTAWLKKEQRWLCFGFLCAVTSGGFIPILWPMVILLPSLICSLVFAMVLGTETASRVLILLASLAFLCLCVFPSVIFTKRQEALARL